MIDIKSEVSELIGEKYDYVILRRNTDIKCSCWRKESNTPDPECPNCEGGGYVFNEYLTKCKMFVTSSLSVAHQQDFDYGKSYSNTYSIYFIANELSNSIRLNDLVFEISVGINGVPMDPIKRTRKWIVIDSIPNRLDLGKLEFVKVFAKPLTV
jgi:hypothetical protein